MERTKTKTPNQVWKRKPSQTHEQVYAFLANILRFLYRIHPTKTEQQKKVYSNFVTQNGHDNPSQNHG